MSTPYGTKPAALSIGLLCLAASLTAQAAPVTYGNYTIDAEYIIGASSGPVQNGMSDTDAWITTYPNGADYSLTKNSSGGGIVPSAVVVPSDGVFFHTYGFDGANAAFGARVSGDGDFLARTSINYNAVYTNTNDTAQNFSFSFGVQEGELAIHGNGSAFTELLLRIRIDGVDVALDHTTLVQDATGEHSCTSNGLGILAGYMDCGSAYGDGIIAAGRNYTLDLGLIDAGASFTLDYDIISIAYGNLSEGVTTSSYYVCDEWEGDPILARAARSDEVSDGSCRAGHYETYTFETSGNAVARSGDPLNQYWTPAGISGAFVGSSVPEPSSIALVGLAFAGLGLASRRKRQGRA